MFPSSEGPSTEGHGCKMCVHMYLHLTHTRTHTHAQTQHLTGTLCLNYFYMDFLFSVQKRVNINFIVTVDKIRRVDRVTKQHRLFISLKVFFKEADCFPELPRTVHKEPSWDPIVVLVQLSPGDVAARRVWRRVALYLRLSYLQATLLAPLPFKSFPLPHTHP